MGVWLVLDDGMKGLIRLKSPHKEVWFEVEVGSQPVIGDGVDIRQGRAKGGEVEIEVRGRLGGNVAQVRVSLVEVGREFVLSPGGSLVRGKRSSACCR